MSEQLKQFLTKWLAWAEAGAVTKEFSPCSGLCNNLYAFAENMFPDEFEQEAEFLSLVSEFHDLLEATMGDADYPFGGSLVYDDEYQNDSMHKNSQRLAWVREQLEKNK